MKFTIAHGLIFFAGLAVGLAVMSASKSLEPSAVEKLELRLHETELRIRRLEANLEVYQEMMVGMQVPPDPTNSSRNPGDLGVPESSHQLSWSPQNDIQN